MRATTGFIRLFIRGLAWDATTASQPFADVLKTAARSKLTDSARGKVLIGSGQGGTTVSYSLPPLGDLTGADLAEVCSAILDRVESLQAGTPGITDADLLVALLAAFPALPIPRSVRSIRPDFSVGGLRR